MTYEAREDDLELKQRWDRDQSRRPVRKSIHSMLTKAKSGAIPWTIAKRQRRRPSTRKLVRCWPQLLVKPTSWPEAFPVRPAEPVDGNVRELDSLALLDLDVSEHFSRIRDDRFRERKDVVFLSDALDIGNRGAKAQATIDN
jgi:hypothetical protein